MQASKASPEMSNYPWTDSALMDRHVTEVVRSCNYHIRELWHIRPLLTPDVAKMLAHSIVTSRLDYANALLSGTTSGNLKFSTDCRWHRIHLPELYVRHRVPPAPSNYDGSSTGCLFDSGSLTSWQSSPTAHDQPAHQST